jgi:hypothetical protein
MDSAVLLPIRFVATPTTYARGASASPSTAPSRAATFAGSAPADSAFRPPADSASRPPADSASRPHADRSVHRDADRSVRPPADRSVGPVDAGGNRRLVGVELGQQGGALERIRRATAAVRWGNERARDLERERASEVRAVEEKLVGNITRMFLKNVQGPCKSGRRE